MATWRPYLDKKSADEVLFGISRGIRSDDTILDIPLILSQLNSPTAFSKINPILGEGKDMALPFKIPTDSWVSFFRPAVWGFYVGSHIGISWMWCFLFFGLFFSVFLSLKSFNVSVRLSLAGGFLALFSPYFQAWHYHNVEPIIHALFAFVLFTKMMDIKKFRYGYGLLLAWCFACIPLSTLYPPRVVLSCYLFLFLCLGWLWDKNKKVEFKKNLVLYVFIVLLILLFVGKAFFDSLESVQKIANTSYPGHRLVTGGDRTTTIMFVEHFLLPPLIQYLKIPWGILGNSCEASSFYLFFPLIFSMVIFKYKEIKKHKLLLNLLGFIFLLIVFSEIGFSKLFAQVSLFSRVTTVRLVPFIGILSLLALIIYYRDYEKKFIFSRTQKVILMVLWFTFHLFLASYLSKILSVPFKYLMLGIFIQTLFSYLIVNGKKIALMGIFIMQIPYFSINRVVYGGVKFLYDNELAIEMGKASQDLQNDLVGENTEIKSNNKWIVVSSTDEQFTLIKAKALSNYPRILGYSSFGGYVCPPDLNSYNFLKITAEDKELINQCGFMTYVFSEKTDGHYTYPLTPGDTLLKIGLEDLLEFITTNQVRFIILVGEKNYVHELFDKKFQFISVVNDNFIYRVLN